VFNALLVVTIDMSTDKALGVAAVRVAKRMGPGHRIITILCDSGSRYLSRFWAEAGDVGGQTDSKLEDIIKLDD